MMPQQMQSIRDLSPPLQLLLRPRLDVDYYRDWSGRVLAESPLAPTFDFVDVFVESVLTREVDPVRGPEAWAIGAQGGGSKWVILPVSRFRFDLTRVECRDRARRVLMSKLFGTSLVADSHLSIVFSRYEPRWPVYARRADLNDTIVYGTTEIVIPAHVVLSVNSPRSLVNSPRSSVAWAIGIQQIPCKLGTYFAATCPTLDSLDFENEALLSDGSSLVEALALGILLQSSIEVAP